MNVSDAAGADRSAPSKPAYATGKGAKDHATEFLYKLHGDKTSAEAKGFGLQEGTSQLVPCWESNDPRQSMPATELYLCGGLASGHLSYVARNLPVDTAPVPGSDIAERRPPPAGPMRGGYENGGIRASVAFPYVNSFRAGAETMDTKANESAEAASLAGTCERMQAKDQMPRRRVSVQKDEKSVRIYVRDYEASDEELMRFAQEAVRVMQANTHRPISVIANGAELELTNAMADQESGHAG